MAMIILFFLFQGKLAGHSHTSGKAVTPPSSSKTTKLQGKAVKSSTDISNKQMAVNDSGKVRYSMCM